MSTVPEGNNMPLYIPEENPNYKLPFDLDNLFNIQVSFDTLKIAIEYLSNQQMEQ